jgi:hypothetical protein
MDRLFIKILFKKFLVTQQANNKAFLSNHILPYRLLNFYKKNILNDNWKFLWYYKYVVCLKIFINKSISLLIYYNYLSYKEHLFLKKQINFPQTETNRFNSNN